MRSMYFEVLFRALYTFLFYSGNQAIAFPHKKHTTMHKIQFIARHTLTL